MKKKYKDALKVGVGAAALGASNYLGKRAGEQDIAKKILASYTGDTDTVLKKTSAFGIAKPTARNKGGQIKPVKAVAGVLAGLAAGVAPGIIGVGMLAKKKMKKKSSTVSSDDVKYSLKDKNMLTDLYQKATKQEATKMNKGGGMDMGAKKPLSSISQAFKEQLGKARAEGTVEKSKTSKYLKKRSRGDKINVLLKSANVSNMNKGGGMDMGQMPNTVKPRPRGNPGIVENVVGKGGDYIKDLID